MGRKRGSGQDSRRSRRTRRDGQPRLLARGPGTLPPAVLLSFSRTGLGRPPETARGGVGLCLQGREVSFPGAEAGGVGMCAGSQPAPRGAHATWWGCPGGHFPHLPGPLSSNTWDVPGGSVADTLRSQCRGPGSVSGQATRSHVLHLRPSPAKQRGSGRSYMIYKT